MNYSFEGNPKNRPEQNLSGASKKLTRDMLLEKTHEERRKRQEQRIKLQSAELLQSHIRSYIARKHKKDEERRLFDDMENISSIRVLLAKLLFFYDPKADSLRLFKISERLISQHVNVLKFMEMDTSFSWLIKRFLVLCLKSLYDDNLVRLMIKPLYIFTNNAQTLEYLIRKGYFGYLRSLMEAHDRELLEQTMILIHRPFMYLYQMENSRDITLSEFCSSFLKPTLTPNIKNLLISYLKSKKDLPFDRIIYYLNSGYHYDSNNSLLYCILALEPDDYEPNCDSIQVLAKLSLNIHILKPPCDLTAEDSDDEEIEISEEQLLLSDYLHIMNKPDKVKKWLHFFELNNQNDQVLMAFTQLCHNLLLVYKDSIRKYLTEPLIGPTIRFLNVEVENSDTSETFTQNDLHLMSTLLKNVAMDLVEVAFPMCRSSAALNPPWLDKGYTRDFTFIQRSCLNCVKMLHMLDMRKQFCPPGFWTAKKIHISPDLSRKNYLSKTVVSFQGIVSDNNDDEHLPPLSTIEQRSLVILEELPFLIAFNTRVLLLRDLCRYSLGENAFDKISTKSVTDESDLRHKVRIQFINSVGLEEAGIDGGGIFKEFINEVLKTAFDPNRGFFLLTADNTLYPNPNVHLIVENFTEHFYFIGRLVGKVMELKPNGRNIPVTNENRLEYIQRLADLKLNMQLKKQCAAFREGLNSVVPLMWLKLFNHRELQVIIGGDTQEIDLSDLRAHSVYGGEFTADHPTVNLFWKILNRFTDTQRKQLLKFVTSCSRPPLLGFKELNPQFCIQSSGTENRMPTASTCLNLLKIPIIKDEETLRSKLLAAIEQQAGFELS
ncbi:hypothetical protein NQ317_012065 [Molorchus minor]|uniref:HECT-type E3 ubiquitin transferase n=1 Tax=Molorchus minor TaxID=1323400 RepID=A0ABQ9K7J4_9CUCU|nr:hypothetical protein NQ317_012065 [Molorchus minor]